MRPTWSLPHQPQSISWLWHQYVTILWSISVKCDIIGIKTPTQDECHNQPHVIITSDSPWDPGRLENTTALQQHRYMSVIPINPMTISGTPKLLDNTSTFDQLLQSCSSVSIVILLWRNSPSPPCKQIHKTDQYGQFPDKTLHGIITWGPKSGKLG